MRYRHVLRRLVRTPGFSAIAILTLALGIGANTAIFSVVEGVLLKPLPYPHPEELIGLWHNAKGLHLSDVNMAPFLYFTYRDEKRTMTDVGLWDGGSVSVTGLSEPEQVDDLQVTDATLPLLGVPPMLGRWFSQADDSPGAPDTMLLMYGYWQMRFGGDRSVVGRRVMVNGRPREVIGVMPQRFRFLNLKPSVILPMRLDRAKTFLGSFSYQGIARLKPGASLEQASADVARMVPIALRSFPAFQGFSVKMFEDARIAPDLRPLMRDVTGTIGGTLWLLMGSIGMVLLIACANVANLLLVRAEGRQQELAVRSALGAGWKTIAAELIAESLTLGIGGGIAGLALAFGALRLLVKIGPANLPRLSDIGIDGWVVLFTLAASLAAGLLFGVIPVWKYAGPNIAGALHGGGRGASQSRERHRARGVLVVVQVALALVLLVSSGLMIRSFRALRNVQAGFTEPEHIQSLRLSIPEAQVKDDVAAVRMEQAIVDRLAGIPGVEAVGLSSVMPLNSQGWHDPVYAENHTYQENQLPALRRYRFISPGLLRSMGNRLAAGRDFTWNEVYDKRPVAMISENLARELWGSPQEAIGKRVRESPKNPWHEVVGVMADEHTDGLDQKPASTVFWPILIDNFAGEKTFVWRTMFYVVRSPRTGTEGFLAEVQRAIWSVNPNLPVASVRSMRTIYDKSLAGTSFTMAMLAIAGGMALLLGMVGIYGVISYSVAQRTREIGIRMALGARRGELTRLFLRSGLRLTLIGVAFGLAASAGLAQLMAKLLFDVKPIDPLTYAAVALCLIGAALGASYLPALRISSIDPMNALRSE